MTHLLGSFIAGLTVLSPVIAMGIVPSSYQGMTRRPGLAAPYAAAGALYLAFFSLPGWMAWRFILPSLQLDFLGLPMLIAVFWAVSFLLSLLLGRAPSVRAGLATQLNGTLAVGGCLILIESSPSGIGYAAATSIGMAAGYFIGTLVLSFVRERMTSGIPSYLRGWPALLILCSVLWLAVQAVGMPLP